MGGLKASPKTLARSYRLQVKTISDLARTLPDRPTPDAVHRLRVGTRRVQAILRLLPREIRNSRRTKTFEAALKALLRLTSEVRDLDTLIETLATEKAWLPRGLMNSLENERSDASAIARSAGKLFLEAAPPSIDPFQLSRKRLSRRLRRNISDHGNRVAILLSTVTTDEAKVEELHSLRKEVRKLRYSTELGAGVSSELKLLTKWQESLGAIHDLDVATDYLLSGRWEPIEPAVAVLMRRRHSAYGRFVAMQLNRPRAIPMEGGPLVPRPAN